ncbi:hypothetical protein F511_31171 [Dorcoceras hygrometricum]|uniref:Uncharacterized protein n=1 Tax=Dorcoceras hygrometricum TaxID=472368 RepID=A0A2Z7BE06_9LAMI|nr:hypothetical protein F511_31171 [Dorcoceras hygrometricum]
MNPNDDFNIKFQPAMSLKEERFNLRIYVIDNRRSPWKDEQLSRCQSPLHHELNTKADISSHLICVQVLGTKKTISSNYICPVDGSQYKRSAIVLVFMKSAAGLAMETSKVESAVRNQAEAKLNQLEQDEPTETMNQLQALKSEVNQLVLATKKTISSSYICPADGSQYKRSAIVLVFMESAAGLAMETSKVESAVLAIQEEEESQAGAGAMKNQLERYVDVISSDVIIQQEATVLETKKTISSSYICPADGSQYKRSAVGLVFIESAVELAMDTSKVESAVLAIQEEEESQAGAGAMKNQLERYVDVISSDVIIQQEATTQEDKSIIVEEDSGEATDETDASNSSIQSRAYMNQLLLLNQSQALHIQSTWFPDARKEEVAKRCIQSQDIVPVASYSALHPIDKDISRR